MVPLPTIPVAGLALSLFGASVAGYLTVEHGAGRSPVCGIGHGCEIVAESSYAHVGDVPTAAFGLFMYLTLALLYGVRLLSPPEDVQRVFRLAIGGIALAGTATSAWLTYVELYVLHAICAWCVASACVVMLLLALSLRDRKACDR